MSEERLRDALRAIIDRSHNGDLGTSKVIDMRKIATEALGEEEERRNHYYLFHVIYDKPDGTVVNARLTIGWPDQRITESRLKEVKRELRCPDSAVPLSVSYLGFMTPEEANS